MLFKKMGCFNASFSPPTRKHLHYLRVCVNFLNFIFDWWRLEFLKLLLICACTSTYHTNALKEIREVESNSLTIILEIDEHFQDLRGLSSLAFQIVLKKNDQFLKTCLAERIAADPCVETPPLYFSIICPFPLYCSHVSRLKDQKCQLLANRFVFSHKHISMRMNTKLLEERLKYITHILSLLSDFC